MSLRARSQSNVVLFVCALTATLSTTSFVAAADEVAAAPSRRALAKSTREPEVAPALPPTPLDAWEPRLPSRTTPVEREKAPQAPSQDGGATGATPVAPEVATGELGISVGLPYFDDEILRPDLTVEGRYAHRFLDMLVPSVGIGFRLARLDPNVVPDEVYGNQIDSPYLSLGVRVEAPVTSWFRPFIGGAADLAWWSTTFDTFDYCHSPSATWYPSAWGCYDKDDWAFAPVYRGQIGLLVKPEPSMALEFVAEAAIIPPGDMFTRQVTLLTPSIGFAWHH